MNEFDKLADELLERRYQLRVEHNHGTMSWYAYYALREQRQLFDEEVDWQTSGQTPTEALQNLKNLLCEVCRGKGMVLYDLCKPCKGTGYKDVS